MASFNAHSRAWYQRYRGDGDGSSEVLAQYLEAALRRGDRRAAIYWRRHLAVTAAKHRALAGDSTAERRLAWRKTVLEQGRHALWVHGRFQALDREIARIVRGGPPCSACAGRLERARENRDEYLAEIAKLPKMVVTYAEFVRRGPTIRLPEEEDTVTPEDTLAEAGISNERQEKYQRRMSSLLAARS